MKKLTVGVSIFATSSLNIWSSGINQNIAFLLMLFKQSPRVGRVVLLNGGDADDLPENFGFAGIEVELLRPEKITHEIDVVVEVGAKLPVDWLRRARTLGAKIISMHCGSTYTDTVDGSLFDLQRGASFNEAPYHEVWMLPHHVMTCKSLYETMHRLPVHVIPYLWSPFFLDIEIKKSEADGTHFGFDAQTMANTGKGWRIGVFEPNLGVVKNSTIPMLICEQAYRSRPEMIDNVKVYNTFHMKEHLSFNSFAASLDMSKDGKATYEQRFPFVDCMTRIKTDAVVSHQWGCGLNNLYYELLHGGYPLIHNSALLHEENVGLYYSGFSAQEGALRLQEAWQQPPDYWADYQQRGRSFTQQSDPVSKANIANYTERLLTGDAA